MEHLSVQTLAIPRAFIHFGDSANVYWAPFTCQGLVLSAGGAVMNKTVKDTDVIELLYCGGRRLA